MQDKTAIINTAQKLAAKGQVDKAIAEWEKLLVNNQDGNVHNTIGDLFLKKGSESDAIVSFSKAAELFKKDGFYPKAIALYKKILNIVPNDVNSLLSLGKLNADKGLVGSAIDYYFKAAEIYHREGSAENATTVVDRILQLSPTDTDTRKKIAYLYFRLGLRKRAANEYASIADDLLKNGDLDQAEEMCNQAIEFDPENTEALISMSKLADSRSDPEKAFEYMERALSLEPDNKSLMLSYAALLINNNQTDEAMTALIKQIEAHPTDLRAKKMLGEIYIKAGLNEQAWNELLPCIDSSMASGKWSDAQTLLSCFTESFPILVKQHLLTIHKAQGNNDALKSELHELAALHEEAGSYNDSMQLYKEIIAITPDDNTALEKLQALEIKLGINPPVTEITSAVETPPPDKLTESCDSPTQQSAPGHINTDIAKAQPDDLPKSDAVAEQREIHHHAEPTPPPEVIHYEEVLSAPDEREPEKPGIVSPAQEGTPSDIFEEKIAEADFYARQGLNDEALEIYKKLLSSDPDNEQINSKINSLNASSTVSSPPAEQNGMDAVGMQNKEEGVQPSVDDDLKDIFAAFGKTEQAAPEDFEARYQEGLEHRQQGRIDDAIKELQIAVQDKDKMVRNATMLAMCYMEKGSYPLAIVGFNKVLDAMSPSDSTYLHVKYELASAYLHNKDVQKALELFSEIHDQTPDFKDVADKLHSLKLPPQEEKPKTKRDRVSYI